MAQTKSLNFSPSTLAKMKSAAFHDGGNKLVHVFNLPLNFDLNPIIFVYKKCKIPEHVHFLSVKSMKRI